MVGVGPGNWSYMRFMIDPLRSAAGAHNSYLAALAEGGVISLALYLVLFYVTMRDLVRCERVAGERRAGEARRPRVAAGGDAHLSDRVPGVLACSPTCGI